MYCFVGRVVRLMIILISKFFDVCWMGGDEEMVVVVWVGEEFCWGML